MAATTTRAPARWTAALTTRAPAWWAAALTTWAPAWLIEVLTSSRRPRRDGRQRKPLHQGLCWTVKPGVTDGSVNHSTRISAKQSIPAWQTLALTITPGYELTEVRSNKSTKQLKYKTTKVRNNESTKNTSTKLRYNESTKQRNCETTKLRNR